MTVWQEGMIRLARSEKVTDFAQRQPWLSGLANQFVGGASVADARNSALELARSGITATLFYLGEYVSDPELISTTLTELEAAITATAEASLDVCVSVDPTQIDLMADAQTCTSNALDLARAVRAAATQPRVGHDALIIDMEDASVTDATIDLYWSLRAEDLLAEPADIAVRSAADRDSRYRRCASQLLGRAAREAGVYPSFATHDHRLIEEIITQAEAQGWPADAFEFEMLYGVRPDLQRELARRGYRVRVYLPFGTDWFPYAVRRVGESPRNLRFAAAALTRRGAAPGGGW